jgi:arylsulfatase A
VVFTSDNGPIELFRERGGSAGPLRGGKNTTWEGGMRVPGIFWGPGLVRPGVVRGLGSQLDLFATFADLARRPLPTDRAFDGASLEPTLRQLEPSPRRTIAYYRQGEVYAVRNARHKAHFVTEDAYGEDTRRAVHEPPLVFDLAHP